MAFESRDGEAKQGIFGPAKTVSEAWPKIAKNFTVSLPLSLGVIKKEPLDGVSYRYLPLGLVGKRLAWQEVNRMYSDLVGFGLTGFQRGVWLDLVGLGLTGLDSPGPA